jgi:hypothetical protein
VPQAAPPSLAAAPVATTPQYAPTQPPAGPSAEDLAAELALLRQQLGAAQQENTGGNVAGNGNGGNLAGPPAQPAWRAAG